MRPGLSEYYWRTYKTNENIIYLTINTNNENIPFLSIYAPDTNTIQEKKRIVVQKSKSFQQQKCLNNGWRLIIQRLNKEVVSNNGKLLIALCTLNKLRIKNTCFSYKHQDKPTFPNTICQSTLIGKYIIATKHSLVLCKYHVNIKPKKKKLPKI